MHTAEQKTNLSIISSISWKDALLLWYDDNYSFFIFLFLQGDLFPLETSEQNYLKLANTIGVMTSLQQNGSRFACLLQGQSDLIFHQKVFDIKAA